MPSTPLALARRRIVHLSVVAVTAAVAAAFAFMALSFSATPAAGSGSVSIPGDNLLPADASSFERSADGWVAHGNVGVRRSKAVSRTGRASLEIVAHRKHLVAGEKRRARAGTHQFGAALPAAPHRPYYGSVHVLPKDVPRPVRCEIRFYDGDRIVHTSAGAWLSQSRRAWVAPVCSGVAPAGTTGVALQVVVDGVAANERHHADDAWLSAGPRPEPGTPILATTTTSTTTTSTTTTSTTTTSPPPTTTSPPPTTTTTAPPPPPPTVAPAPSGAMPTTANTGPASRPAQTMTAAELLRTGECRDRRITDQVRVEDWSDIAAWNRTFTIDGCVLEGGFWWVVGSSGDYPVESYPDIRIRNTDILGSMTLLSPAKLTMESSYVSDGAFWAPCPDCAGPSFGLVRQMPIVVRDSLFVHPLGALPAHTEALHVAGTGQGYRFHNTRFVQHGPYNDSQTSALFFHGGDSVFDGCWFDYAGPAAAHYTVYLYGRGPGAGSNVVTRSAIQRGMAGYSYDVRTEGLVPARFADNRDFETGAVPVP